MVGHPETSAGEAALAVGGALSVRQPEGRDHDLTDRRHRRRIADRRRGWDWRKVACRLLLRTDHPDMGDVAGVGDPRLRIDRVGGPVRAHGRVANGGTAMNPRRLGFGLLVSAAGVLSVLILPLSAEPTGTLQARPAILVMILSAALLFVIAAWRGGVLAVALGAGGVVSGCAATLALLRDPTIAGSAAAG